MDASLLSYTSTPSGVVLSTPLGPVRFDNDVFMVYKYLFEVLDIDDDGRICFNQCLFILMRTNLPKGTLLRAWGNICAHKDEDIVLEQWLVLCKVLSYNQANRNNSDVEIREVLMCQTVPLLQLNLSITLEALELPRRLNPAGALDIDVIGWCEVGEGMNKHVEYTVRYVTSLSCFSHSEWEVRRRYSDFKLLYDKLERYEGSLVPPLPPKQMLHSLNHDLPAQRSQELSLFLRNLARHPVLYGSYELKIFLEASEGGFAAYKSLLKKIAEVEAKETSTSGLSPSSVSNGSSAVAAAGALAAGYAWSVWSSVNRYIARPSAAAPLPCVDDELEGSFTRLSGLLSALGTATCRMGTLIDCDKRRCHELSRISCHLRQAGELDGNRRFDSCAIATAKCVDVLLLTGPNSLDLQSLEIYFHLQNLARFQEVLKNNSSRRDGARTAVVDAQRRVEESRKSLAAAKAGTNSGADEVLKEEELQEAKDALRREEKKCTDMDTATKHDLKWLERVTKFELQGRVLGFVQMRAASAQREAEVWESLAYELKEGTSRPVPYAEEEDDGNSMLTGHFL
mmetsp:Transcript_19563/g.28136  ORF Transcript_19563/g.28136 Transcript_19563/m.28136 type:complete len:568 (-) Transcript_19563:120-1823(-)